MTAAAYNDDVNKLHLPWTSAWRSKSPRIDDESAPRSLNRFRRSFNCVILTVSLLKTISGESGYFSKMPPFFVGCSAWSGFCSAPNEEQISWKMMSWIAGWHQIHTGRNEKSSTDSVIDFQWNDTGPISWLSLKASAVPSTQPLMYSGDPTLCSTIKHELKE